MAGTWIPMRIDLEDDPTVIFIASKIKLKSDQIVGKLFRFWCWVDAHTDDGNLHGVTPAWVDKFVGRKGFADAMASAPYPWLTISATGLSIPNFGHWFGKSSKNRMANTRRQQELRARDNSATNGATKSATEARPQDRTGEESTEHTPPPPQKGSSPSPSAKLPPEWAAVEEILFGFEVREAARAVASCREHGCSPMQVRNLIEFWRGQRPAWDEAALFERLMRYRPDQDFMLLWLPRSTKADKQVAAAKSTEKANEVAAQRRQRDAEQDAKKANDERLEATFGQTLDALPAAEVKRMIAELYPDKRQRDLATISQSKTGPLVGALRVELLAEIERRWKEEN